MGIITDVLIHTRALYRGMFIARRLETQWLSHETYATCESSKTVNKKRYVIARHWTVERSHRLSRRSNLPSCAAHFSECFHYVSRLRRSACILRIECIVSVIALAIISAESFEMFDCILVSIALIDARSSDETAPTWVSVSQVNIRSYNAAARSKMLGRRMQNARTRAAVRYIFSGRSNHLLYRRLNNSEKQELL